MRIAFNTKVDYRGNQLTNKIKNKKPASFETGFAIIFNSYDYASNGSIET